MTEAVVGQELARAVAQALQGGKILAETHRDYCGIGLAWLQGQFICAEVFDGEITTPQMAQNMRSRGENPEFQAFPDEAAFFAWLAAQSDASLSGRELPNSWAHDNQRLTIARLQAFVA